jgi:hypothetical protein
MIRAFKPFSWHGLMKSFLHYCSNELLICHVLIACLARGYIPKAWRLVKATFILKAGKANYTEAEAYPSINPSSFMLKTIEKLVDRHQGWGIKAFCLTLKPVCLPAK